jgi:hypothetical protein
MARGKQHVQTNRIVGGTCSICGNYDPCAIAVGEGELQCSKCTDVAWVIATEQHPRNQKSAVHPVPLPLNGYGSRCGVCNEYVTDGSLMEDDNGCLLYKCDSCQRV